MRVGTRITAATSALVAVSLSVYAFAELRGNAAARRREATDQARDVAAAVRASLESRPVVQALETALENADELSQVLSRSNDWDIKILRTEVPPAEDSQPGQILAQLVKTRADVYAGIDNDRLVMMVPLRRADPSQPDGLEIAGAVEVSRSITHLEAAWTTDVIRTLPILGVIVLLVVTAIMLLTRTLITNPIAKLIRGIDDVAHGDLSSVLMSEREDEIGTLATRFNEMTHSLRESRAETERQNAARLHLEERVSQTEKLATIGQLAAEIAHEVGTPLNVIAGRARGIASKAEEQKLKKHANIIAEQADRITRIIQRLLDFTRRRQLGTEERDAVNLDEVVLSAFDLLSGKLQAAKIKHSLHRAEDLPPVDGHPDQIQQVVINLMLNAIEAMPRGGRLRVESSQVVRRRPGLEMEPEQTFVVVEVIDTGQGISPEAREKIFEPFYTSKNLQGGTGLGLAVSHGIIKEHDGWLEVESPVPAARGPDFDGDSGALFRINLPASSR